MDKRIIKEFQIINDVIKRDLCVEILHSAFEEMKQDPKISIEQAINRGINEWDK